MRVEAASDRDARTRAGDLIRGIMNHPGADIISMTDVSSSTEPWPGTWNQTDSGNHWFDVYVYNLAVNELYQVYIRSVTDQLPAAQNEAIEFANNSFFSRNSRTTRVTAAVRRNGPPPGFVAPATGVASVGSSGMPATVIRGDWYEVGVRMRNAPYNRYTVRVEADGLDVLAVKARALYLTVFNQASNDSVTVETDSARTIYNPYAGSYSGAPADQQYWYDTYVINPATSEAIQIVFRGMQASPTGNANPDFRAYTYATESIWTVAAQHNGLRVVPWITRAAAAIPADALGAPTPDITTAPTRFTVTGVTDGLNTSWEMVAGAPRYILRYRPTGNGAWQTIITAERAHTITGLDYSILYEVEVAVQNTSGNPGQFSAIRRSPRQPIDYPGMPEISAGPGSLTARWSALQNAQGYRLIIATSENLTQGRQTVEVAVPATTHTFEGLQPGTRYWVAMEAFNRDFTTRPSSARDAVPLALPAATGGTPVRPTTGARIVPRNTLTPAEAMLSWTVVVRIQYNATRREDRTYTVQARTDALARTAAESLARGEIRGLVQSIRALSASAAEEPK